MSLMIGMGTCLILDAIIWLAMLHENRFDHMHDFLSPLDVCACLFLRGVCTTCWLPAGFICCKHTRDAAAWS